MMKKKHLCLSLAVTAMLIASGCGDTGSSAAPSSVQDADTAAAAPETDIILYPFEELIERSDIIMIGEYMADPEYQVSCRDSEKKQTPYECHALSSVRPIKVFKGEELVGDEPVEIYENYAYISAEDGSSSLFTMTGFSPKGKGSRMIFLLEYNEAMQRYIPFEIQGRFPLPEDEGIADSLGYTNGLIDSSQFDRETYNRIIEKYNIS